jgi:predicted nicotinamide N-methyase
MATAAVRPAVPPAADADPGDHDSASSLLLHIESLLWELAPRATIATALTTNGLSTSEEQQRVLLRALAAPPPHAPALLPLRTPPDASSSLSYPPGYLAGVLQRCTAAFTREGALDDALAEKLQQAVLAEAEAAAAEAAAAGSGGGGSGGGNGADSPTPTPTTLLKTWCYLPARKTSAAHVFGPSLRSLREQADERRRRAAAAAGAKNGGAGGGDGAEATPHAAATTTPATTSAGLVSLRLSPDIFAAGTGATTWAAGFVLAEWLLSRRARRFVRGKRVLELGAGAGLSGVCAWRAGAAALTLTDGDAQALRNCARNVSANLSRQDQQGGVDLDLELELEVVEEGTLPLPLLQKNPARSLRCLALQWDEAPRLPECVAEPDDLVIAADVAYDPLILPGLTRALGALLRRRRGRRRSSGGGGEQEQQQQQPQAGPLAVVATTVRQEATLALLLDLAEREGLRFTEEAEWWRQQQRARRQGGGEGEDEEEESDQALAAAEAAAEDRPWGDDPRFVTVQGLDRRGIRLHVVELLVGGGGEGVTEGGRAGAAAAARRRRQDGGGGGGRTAATSVHPPPP